MFLIRKVIKNFVFANFSLINVRHFCLYDKNINNFRTKAEYQNLMVQPVQDSTKFKTSAISELSFPKHNEKSQMDGFFYHLLQRENVMKLSNPQVKDVLSILANSDVDSVKYATALKFLDEKCAISVERWPLDLSFYILDAWHMIFGPKIFRKHYYSAVTSQWSRRIRKCTKPNLILALHYIGLSKSAQPFLMDSLLDRMENFLPDFSDEEIAIACLGFFKCSKRIKSSLFLQRACEAVEKLLQKNDHFNVISILKCLRLSKYQDSQVYDLVKTYALQNYTSINLVVCTNFLALFATQNIYNQELFDVLEVQAVSVLKKEEESNMSEESVKIHPSLRYRVKDIARLLWALTTVGHSVKDETLTVVSSCIEKRLTQGEYGSQLPVLVDTLQSLVMTGYYPKEIFLPALNLSLFKKIGDQDKAKPKYQLYFVEKSVHIEFPEFSAPSLKVTNPIPKHLDKEINERKGFRELLDFLNHNFTNSFVSCYVMPHIMIAGIFFSKPPTSPDTSIESCKVKLEEVIAKPVQAMIKKNSDCFCIEILDSSVCNGKQPTGLMLTKIRQLRKLDFEVIVLSSGDIDNIIKKTVKADSEVDNFLKECLA